MGGGTAHLAHVKITVRAASAADLTRVVELRLALIREHGDNPVYRRLRPDASDRARRLFATQLASSNERIFLAEDEGRVVGIIRCVETVGSPLLDPARYAYVSSAYVLPEARRRGTLRALVAAARSWCDERGLSELRLHSVAGDAASNAAWDALGFTIVEHMRIGGARDPRQSEAHAAHSRAGASDDGR